MSEPYKSELHKLVIALLDRADALHREEKMMLELGHASAYSKLIELKAENDRLRKAGDDLAVAWARVRTDYHTWDVAVKAWDAAKEGGRK